MLEARIVSEVGARAACSTCGKCLSCLIEVDTNSNVMRQPRSMNAAHDAALVSVKICTYASLDATVHNPQVESVSMRPSSPQHLRLGDLAVAR